MLSRPQQTTCLVFALATFLAIPAAARDLWPGAGAGVARAELPLITPAPELPTRTRARRLDRLDFANEADWHARDALEQDPYAPDADAVGRRDIFSDIETFAGGAFSDIASLGSAAASYVTSEFAIETNFLAGLPTDGKGAESALGIDDSSLAASPTMVLNLPQYGNWTDKGWNLRFRANVYKLPNITTSKLDDLANKFLIGTSIQDLPAAQQTHARNVTAEIFVVQQSNQNLTFDLRPAASQGASGEPGGGGGATPAGGNQTVKYPVPTTEEGDIDGFVAINSTGLSPGNATTINQRLNVYTHGTESGNSTAFLVPVEGMTIISDIDDILRVTKIWDPKEGIFNTFAANFTPWVNMPDIYANWSRSIEGLHFHYLTTTPEQVTRNYMDFIYKTYPGGTFDTRPLNFSDVSATLSIRKYLLQRVIETFPKRRFVLVADTSNSDVMRDYPEMATQFPGQISCILLRNTSSTDPSDKLPYDTSHFQGLNKSTYMFFHVPDDLTNIDIANGGCVNASIKQNVTFSEQGLPFGLSKNEAAPRKALGALGWAALVAGVAWIL